jgi:hypothetical protein
MIVPGTQRFLYKQINAAFTDAIILKKYRILKLNNGLYTIYNTAFVFTDIP